MDSSTPEDLTTKKCVPCEGGVPSLSEAEVASHLTSVEGWALTPDGKRIRRRWTVRDFATGIEFFNQVATLSELENHHPDLHLEGYRRVSIEISTHAVGGLTLNDFILAAKINQIPVKIGKQPNS